MGRAQTTGQTGRRKINCVGSGRPWRCSMSSPTLTLGRLRRSLILLCVVNGAAYVHLAAAPAVPFHAQAATVQFWPGRLLVISMEPGSALPPQFRPRYRFQPAPRVVHIHVRERDLYRQSSVRRGSLTLSVRVLRGLGLFAAL